MKAPPIIIKQINSPPSTLNLNNTLLSASPNSIYIYLLEKFKSFSEMIDIILSSSLCFEYKQQQERRVKVFPILFFSL